MPRVWKVWWLVDHNPDADTDNGGGGINIINTGFLFKIYKRK
jgi:hypothetical protein